ncbi:MAG: DUF5996 family protein [Candidatus Dormibacteria bacterium]
MTPAAEASSWPALPYEDWRPTRDTLHMYTQVIGKLRLALSPFEPGWANVALYVTARGLSTSPLRVGNRAIDAELDLVSHEVAIRSSDGRIERRPLGGAVADFYGDTLDALARLDVDVRLSDKPQEIPDAIPFPDDRVHNTYVPAAAARFHSALSTVDLVLKEYHAHFMGRSTPVHFFWGTFDIAVTRYSGHRAQPKHTDPVLRYSEDAEEICSGWWPGDEQRQYAAFYSYLFPTRDGMEQIPLEPSDARWDERSGLFLLTHESVRTSQTPDDDVRAFLQTTYTGQSRIANWDESLTQVNTPLASGITSDRRTADAGE